MHNDPTFGHTTKAIVQTNVLVANMLHDINSWQIAESQTTSSQAEYHIGMKFSKQSSLVDNIHGSACSNIFTQVNKETSPNN